MADVEELIRDLLHPTKETRETAISKLSENWNMELRPYIWKAIENEREKPLQRKMVSITIAKLGDKSLRKMIRFVENGELFDSSINEIIRAYAQHETDEVRESLMKAILRNSHKINEFVNKLFTSRDLELMDASRVLSLLSEIFNSDCQDSQKYQFSRAIALHTVYSDVKPYLDEGFRHKFKDNPIVRKGVLDIKFEQEQNIKRKPWFIWTRTDWDKIELPEFNSLDDYLVESLNFRDNKLRFTVISILGSSSQSTFNFINSNQWQAIFDIWNGLFQNKIELDFIKTADYSEDSLEEFFGENFLSLYQDLRLSEIHPHQIRRLALILLPRSLLYRMARDDPEIENRALCFRSLKRPSFFFTNFEDQTRLIGSHDFIVQLLRRCITAMQHEQTDQARQEAYELYEFLLNNIFELYHEDFQYLKSKLEELDFLSLIEIEDGGYTTTARILLKLLLNIPITGDDVSSTSLNSSYTIVRKFVTTIEKQESSEFLIKLFETQKFEIRMQIINEIEEVFANRIILDEEKTTNIRSILDLAKSDSSIKIRSYARLLLNKLQ